MFWPHVSSARLHYSWHVFDTKFSLVNTILSEWGRQKPPEDFIVINLKGPITLSCYSWTREATHGIWCIFFSDHIQIAVSHVHNVQNKSLLWSLIVKVLLFMLHQTTKRRVYSFPKGWVLALTFETTSFKSDKPIWVIDNSIYPWWIDKAVSMRCTACETTNLTRAFEPALQPLSSFVFLLVIYNHITPLSPLCSESETVNACFRREIELWLLKYGLVRSMMIRIGNRRGISFKKWERFRPRQSQLVWFVWDGW